MFKKIWQWLGFDKEKVGKNKTVGEVIREAYSGDSVHAEGNTDPKNDVNHGGRPTGAQRHAERTQPEVLSQRNREVLASVPRQRVNSSGSAISGFPRTTPSVRRDDPVQDSGFSNGALTGYYASSMMHSSSPSPKSRMDDHCPSYSSSSSCSGSSSSYDSGSSSCDSGGGSSDW